MADLPHSDRGDLVSVVKLETDHVAVLLLVVTTNSRVESYLALLQAPLYI